MTKAILLVSNILVRAEEHFVTGLLGLLNQVVDLCGRHPRLKIFKYRLNRHTRPPEYPCAAHLTGDALHGPGIETNRDSPFRSSLLQRNAFTGFQPLPQSGSSLPPRGPAWPRDWIASGALPRSPAPSVIAIMAPFSITLRLLLW
jgi:hypothetical protein